MKLLSLLSNIFNYKQKNVLEPFAYIHPHHQIIQIPCTQISLNNQSIKISNVVWNCPTALSLYGSTISCDIEYDQTFVEKMSTCLNYDLRICASYKSDLVLFDGNNIVGVLIGCFSIIPYDASIKNGTIVRYYFTSDYYQRY
jgi:hypothetical protein